MLSCPRMYYSNIDDKNPATLSHKIINDIIREELGFSGAIISDCITMDALKKYHPEDIINHLLEIGFDMVTITHQAPEIIERIINNIKNNSKESKKRLEKLYKAPTRGLYNFDSIALDTQSITPSGINQGVI